MFLDVRGDELEVNMFFDDFRLQRSVGFFVDHLETCPEAACAEICVELVEGAYHFVVSSVFISLVRVALLL